MGMPVIGISMAVRMRMAGAVGVHMFVLVEHDFELAPERLGDAAQGLEARHVVAAFEARDHRLGHAEPRRQLLLRLAGLAAQLQQFGGALPRNRRAVVAGLLRSHFGAFANLRSRLSIFAKSRSMLLIAPHPATADAAATLSPHAGRGVSATPTLPLPACGRLRGEGAAPAGRGG